MIAVTHSRCFFTAKTRRKKSLRGLRSPAPLFFAGFAVQISCLLRKVS
jgi:hypothetical protein